MCKIKKLHNSNRNISEKSRFFYELKDPIFLKFRSELLVEIFSVKLVSLELD